MNKWKIWGFIVISTMSTLGCIQQAEKPELTVWFERRFSSAYNDIMIDRITSFAEEKGVKINHEAITVSDFIPKLNAALEAGNPPDIVEMSLNKILNYYPNDHFEDITDLVEQIHSERAFLPSVHNPNNRLEDKYYFAPMMGEVSIMYLRKDILDKHKITKIPTTWEEVWETAQTINDPENGLYGYGFGSGPIDGDGENIMRQIIWNYGGSIFNEQGDIVYDTPLVRELLTKYVEFQKNALIPPSAVSWDGSGNNKSYLLGESAIIVNAASLYQSLVNTPENSELLSNTIFAESPGGPINNVKLGIVSGMAITLKSQNKELAKELILSFYNSEWYDKSLDLVSPFFAPVFADFLDNEEWNQDIGKSLGLQYVSTATGYYGYPVKTTEGRAIAAKHYFTFPTARILNQMIIDDVPVEEAIQTMKKEIEDLKEILQ